MIEAFHVSPYRFDAFDWRSHLGAGMGCAAFGCGSYLCRAENVDFYVGRLRRRSGSCFVYAVRLDGAFWPWSKPEYDEIAAAHGVRGVPDALSARGFVGSEFFIPAGNGARGWNWAVYRDDAIVIDSVRRVVAYQ